MAIACAIGALIPSTGVDAQIWDENDFVVSSSAAIVVLDENYQFKAARCLCDGPLAAGPGYGSLDWFGNGDLLVGRRFDIVPGAFRYDRNGVQVEYLSPSTQTARTADYKVSFTQNDFFVGGFGGGIPPSISRFDLNSLSVGESASFTSWGGVAVVPRLDGSHELWVAFEGDFLGIRIYQLDASGRADLSRYTLANPSLPAASVTMTYDPHAHRVLFSNMPGNQVFALDVETHALAQTYTVPASQSDPRVVFTGLTSGPNGAVLAMESFESYEVPVGRRVGLSIWNADGSNYRFVNLDGLPGYDLYVPFGIHYAVPYNILWTGNSPEFRNGAPSVACASPTVMDCVPPNGATLELTAAVTDTDPGQTLTVTLEESGTIIGTQSVLTPLDAALVTFANVELLPGDQVLTVRVSDGRSDASCDFHVALHPRTGPSVVTSPVDVTLECPSEAVFGTPTFTSSCDDSLNVTHVDTHLATNGIEKSKVRRTWTATDDDGRSIATSQTITVVDTVAPQFASVPGDIIVEITSGNGASVTYAPAIASDACGAMSIQYSAPSGSMFAIGTTTVTCTAIDDVGNRANASFQITVKNRVIAPPSTPIAIVQLDALIQLVKALPIPMRTKAVLQLNLSSAKAAIVANKKVLAIELLKLFEGGIDALVRSRQLTCIQATPLKSASANIRAVLAR